MIKITCDNCKKEVLKNSMSKHRKSKKCRDSKPTSILFHVDNDDKCEPIYDIDSDQDSTESDNEDTIPFNKENNVILDLMCKSKLQKLKVKDMCIRIWNEEMAKKELIKQTKDIETSD